ACFGCTKLPTAEPLKEAQIQAFDVQESLLQALDDLRALTILHRDSTTFPRSWDISHQALVTDPDYVWTSGFYAGCLWQAFALSGDSSWLPEARQYTWAMEQQRHNTSTHDLGFMLMNSFGQGLACEERLEWEKVLQEAAVTLSQRFVPSVGAMQSSGPMSSVTCPVIIDNLMNLELLFWASRYTGDQTYFRMAQQHADFSLKNHQRDDGSTVHVVVWDKEETQWKYNLSGQGKTEQTTWSRGQAWAIYGFTMVYQYTRETRFLKAAQKAADYWIGALPHAEVPFWDFDIEAGDPPFRDAAAAAIGAVGLLKLAHATGNEQYFEKGRNTLIRLSLPPYQDPHEPFILSHAVGSVPHTHDVNRPLIYADYYYLEGLTYLLNQEIDVQNLGRNNTAAATIN
ncbi:MAG: hypothetical protein AAFR59_10195, partial [Bacteroidota bacterium]